KNVTAVTKKSIIWNADDKVVTQRKIQGAQKLRAPGDKLFEMVRGLLTFQEIVLIPLGPKGYEVWVAIDARQLANQFILKNKPVYVDLSTGSEEMIEARLRDIENQDGLFVATTLKVKNIDNLRDARTALARIVTGQNVGNVQEVPAAR